MSEEPNQPNTPPVGGEGGSNAPAKPNTAPALPSQKPPVVPQVPDELANDPGYQKWAEDTKDLPNAYKRYADSSKEAKAKADEATKLQASLQEREQYISDVSAELNTLFTSNPELKKQFDASYERLRKGELPNPATPSTQPNAATTIPGFDELRSEVNMIRQERREKMKANIETFKDTYQGYISDDKEWKQVTALAEGLYGRPGRNGKPMDEVAALQYGLEIVHPEIRDDKVRLKTLAERMNRDSASVPGNFPSGSTGGGQSTQLNSKEQKAAEAFGMSPEKYASMLRRD